ncbi:MAG: hypothetical protein LBU66_06635 [Treponema sp.]|jgi:hypothetical protein|nr:hypothetical protein [Treponema sp.]
MKNKLLIILGFLFFLGVGSNLAASETDFYGTWFSKIIEDDETLIITFTISQSDLVMEMDYYDTFESYNEKFHVEIHEWVGIANDDYETYTDYPDGYSILISMENEVLPPIEVFISRDKTSFTIPDFNFDFGEVIVFTKQ